MYWTQGLHRSLQQTPDAAATVFESRVRTFREQAGRVARLAGALRELGVRDGECVGILAPNSDRYAELLLAVPWANGVLNPVNVRWSAAEVAHALQESETGILFVDDSFASLAEGARTVVRMGDYEDLISSAEPIDDARRGGHALAALFYTGGTTGSPKGVMLSHAGLLSGALAVRATVPWVAATGGRTLVAAPMSHLSGVIGWLLQSMCGGVHVILPTFEPAAVLEAIERHRVTHVFLAPAMLRRILDDPAAGDHDLSSLKTVIYGASPIAEALLDRAMAAVPDASFMQVYSMTELAATGTFLTPDDHREGARLRSAGRPVFNLDVRIVDEEANELPRGAVGEVVCRTDCAMLGYWDQPAETAEALRGGWLHTGDAGYMDDDGYVYIVDRLKDMIISDGLNVYSAEVENAIDSHPAVAACAVIGVPDAEWGERVHAVVVPKRGETVAAEALEEHCRRHIGHYKVPRSWDFRDALPLSPAGKVLKRELRNAATGHPRDHTTWDAGARSARIADGRRRRPSAPAGGAT
jgi:acyl-CoA synthetase (AMP-forming)/AMP-acid ligase II